MPCPYVSTVQADPKAVPTCGFPLSRASLERRLEHVFEDLALCDEALAALRAAEVAAARAAVAQWDAALGVWESTPGSFRVGRRPQAQAEIATALGLSDFAADQRVRMGESLRSWPLLRGLLVDGRLGVPHALGAVDEVMALGDEALAGRVLTRVLAFEGRLGWDSTPAKLRSALQVAAVLLDPESAARRRQERQAAESRVRLRPRSDGMADLTATGPAEQLTAADRLLDLLAAPTGPDDERTLGQRQVDALVSALVRSAGVAVPVELQLEIPVRLAVAGLVAQDDADRTALPEPLVVVTDLGPELLDRLQGGPVPPADDDPADREPEPATPDERQAARAAGEAADDREAGDVEAVDVEAVDVAGAGRSAAAARRASSSVPLDEEAGVSLQAARRHRPHGGVPLLAGHGPLDRARLAELLTDPAGLPVGLSGVRVRRVLVSRDGQAVAADAGTVALGRLLAQADGPLRALLADLPDPPPRTEGYRPTAAQERTVQARDRCCSFPGCSRRASRTDLDHRVPWPEGPTSTANLHPLCRRHHRLKHDGWRCVRQLDGSTTWTSPRGLVRHTARP